MSHFIQQLNDKTLCATISGVMSKEDFAAVQAEARALISQVGKINVLIILREFSGFGRGVDWGNMEFYAQHADDILKMALVGDEKWKQEAEVFTGKGARKTQIEFFPTESFGKAHTWILSA